MGELEIYTADIWGIADNGFLKFGSTALRREILSNRGPGAL